MHGKRTENGEEENHAYAAWTAISKHCLCSRCLMSQTADASGLELKSFRYKKMAVDLWDYRLYKPIIVFEQKLTRPYCTCSSITAPNAPKVNQRPEN